MLPPSGLFALRKLTSPPSVRVDPTPAITGVLVLVEPSSTNAAAVWFVPFRSIVAVTPGPVALAAKV